MKTKFTDIQENNFFIWFANDAQLHSLVDNLQSLSYYFGTGGSPIKEINDNRYGVWYGVWYVGEDDRYLEVPDNNTPYKWVSFCSPLEQGINLFTDIHT